MAKTLDPSFTLLNVRNPHDQKSEDGLKIGQLSFDEDSFNSWDAVTNYVTRNWRDNFVIAQEVPEGCSLNLRPFVIRVVVLSDASLGNDVYLKKAFGKARIVIRLHSYERLSESLATLFTSNNLEERWCRPSWDSYFMQLATMSALRTNCMKRRVGAVIVHGGKRTILATGYNGTPRGLPNCSSGGCARCNDAQERQGCGLSECLCLHAEENALLQLSMSSQSLHSASGSALILYCTTMPCLGCAKKIVQAGISRVYFAEDYALNHNSLLLFEMAKVSVQKLDPSEPTCHFVSFPLPRPLQ